jgi:hypothetical protein
MQHIPQAGRRAFHDDGFVIVQDLLEPALLHAAGHNRSEQPWRTILTEWTGADTFPTSPVRFSYQGLWPRSKEPLYQKQLRMTFPQMFGGQPRA